MPTEPPAWAEAYADPSRPLVLDVGCGYGRFLLALSTCVLLTSLLPDGRQRAASVIHAVRAGLIPPPAALLQSRLHARREAMPGHNMLGLEIRGPIIERANKWAASLGLDRAVLFLR